MAWLFHVSADFTGAHAPDNSDRHAAALALSCIGPFILTLLLLGTTPSLSHSSHRDSYGSGALQQATAFKDYYDDATSGFFSAAASDDSMRRAPDALPIFTCDRLAQLAAPRCLSSYTYLHVVPEALSENLAALLLLSCDALAPLLGFACMLGSGVVDHYACLECCAMQAAIEGLPMHSHVFEMRLSSVYSALLLALFCPDSLRTGHDA